MVKSAGVITFLCKKLLVRSVLYNPSVIHDKDKVGIFNGGDAVRNDEDGTLTVELFELVLDVAFGLHIYSGGRIIENQDRRFF